MWICRAGKDAVYLDQFIDAKRIYLTWEGYNVDLSNYKNMDQYRKLVVSEKGMINKTSISNWAGQLQAFHEDMQINDYVLIPGFGSYSFTLARILGRYEYLSNIQEPFHHSRKIKIIQSNIPADIFTKTTRYSLRAYRTLYRVRGEDQILTTINNWRDGR